MELTTMTVGIEGGIARVALNRPQKRNALDEAGWRELEQVFHRLNDDPTVRVVVLRGEGKHFCAGIDLALLMSLPQQIADDCQGRSREKLHRLVQALQRPINAIENCRKPVLAAVHNACVGAGVDIITACDMRYATAGAFFAVAEIDMWLVADLGTLQRLPRLVGEGRAREMAYTGRRVTAAEAERMGLVNRVFDTKDEMMAAVLATAETIAAKSPLVIRGTKEVLNFSRDHSVTEGLRHVAVWNAAMLMSNDLMEAFQASLQGRSPEFVD